jgi:hypothetical protein
VARLFWLLVMLAFVAVLLAGASWAAAYSAVGHLLGSPPPDMGNRSVTFLWDGMPQLPSHPRVWCFTFGPTRIAGVPKARIYVKPTGQILVMEPADLPARLKAFHNPTY